jgi:hypothetical protein
MDWLPANGVPSNISRPTMCDAFPSMACWYLLRSKNKGSMCVMVCVCVCDGVCV